MAGATILLPRSPVESLDDYLAAGGGAGIERARQLGPDATIKEVVLSGLRGRGGAGFPTGRKWASVRDAEGQARYAVVNAAEGEPGTFKDRALIRANPYQLLEGLVIAALAVGASETFVATKAGFRPERARLAGAAAEMDGAGLLEGLTVVIVAGPDEYLFGEEKALLEVIEGRDPLPRLLPPYLHGLFATAPQLGWEAVDARSGRHAEGYEVNPTLVNNVETLSNVPHILARGPEWFRSMGTSRSPGTIVCTLVGDVARPGVVELELGTPLAELVARCGGPVAGERIKAMFSGVANPVLTAERLSTPLTYEDFTAAGSGLGAAGFIAYDDRTCMVEVARAFSRFLYVESCGQCPPCKLNSGEITAHLEALERGAGSDADVEQIGGRLRSVTDGNRCYLAVEEQLVVASILRSFGDEFAEHLEGRCPRPKREVLVPKVLNLADGEVVYDRSQARKRPDWTYEELG